MKKLVLMSFALLTGCRDDADQTQQQLQQAKAQLAEQTAKTGTLEGIIALLGIGCVVFLVIGAAVGSKARKAAKNGTAQ